MKNSFSFARYKFIPIQNESGPIQNNLNERQLLMQILNLNESHRACPIQVEHLLSEFGSIRSLINADVSRLKNSSCLTRKQIAAVIFVKKLLHNVLRSGVFNYPTINNLQSVKHYMTNALRNSCKEEFHCLYLNKSFEVIAHECLQSGTIDHVMIYPRELIHRVLSHNSCAIILVHNHPSSNSRPSRSDISMTRQLADLLKTLRIVVSDHLIVSRRDVFSFKEQGLL